MREEEDQVRLPGELLKPLLLTICISAKIANLRRIPTMNSRVPVQLNAFRIDLSHAAPEEYQFEIRFFAIRTVQPRGQQDAPQIKEFDLAKGPENE
jgi:hypothetical protein